MEATLIGFPPLTMAVFVGIAVGALLLDMVTHRGDKPVSLAKASVWSVFWIAISLAFAGFLYVQHGPQVASLFVTRLRIEFQPDHVLRIGHGLRDRHGHRRSGRRRRR